MTPPCITQTRAVTTARAVPTACLFAAATRARSQLAVCAPVDGNAEASAISAFAPPTAHANTFFPRASSLQAAVILCPALVARASMFVGTVVKCLDAITMTIAVMGTALDTAVIIFPSLIASTFATVTHTVTTAVVRARRSSTVCTRPIFFTMAGVVGGLAFAVTRARATSTPNSTWITNG